MKDDKWQWQVSVSVNFSLTAGVKKSENEVLYPSIYSSQNHLRRDLAPLFYPFLFFICPKVPEYHRSQITVVRQVREDLVNACYPFSANVNVEFYGMDCYQGESAPIPPVTFLSVCRGVGYYTSSRSVVLDFMAA